MSYRNRNGEKIMTIIVTIITVMIFAFILLFAPVACTDEETTRRVLSQQGYTDIRITGFRFFGGGEGDMYKTGFEAISPTGHAVTGVVTNGWTKGATVRFD